MRGPERPSRGSWGLTGRGPAYDVVRARLRAEDANPSDPQWVTIARLWPVPLGRCVGCGSLPRHPVHGELERLELRSVRMGGEDVDAVVDVCRFCRRSVEVRVREWLQFKRRALIERGYIV